MSFSRASTTPSGSLENASSVGANTVNGPALFKVPIKFAAPRAAARVLNFPEEINYFEFNRESVREEEVYLQKLLCPQYQPCEEPLLVLAGKRMMVRKHLLIRSDGGKNGRGTYNIS